MKAHTIQVCFVGDSFVAGIGDETALGWTGRLTARQASAGQPITAYNLGIRRNTSADILARCVAEVEGRRAPDRQTRVVLSMGVNDTTHEAGMPRVALEDSCHNLERILDALVADPLMVVGPPAVADDAQNARIADLSRRFAEICSARDVPYAAIFTALENDPQWRRQVFEGDGAHPGARGYQRLYELLTPVWDPWMNDAGHSPQR